MSETAPRPDVPDEIVAAFCDAFWGASPAELTPGIVDLARTKLPAVVPVIERQVRERVAAETRRETAERVLLASDVTLGYRCPACHGKPAAHRWKDTGRKKRYVCGCGHQWDAPSRSTEWRTALDASPTALLRKVAETGELPDVPAKIARGEAR